MHGAFCRTPIAKVIVQTARTIRNGVHHDELSRAKRPVGPPRPTVRPATAGSTSVGRAGESCAGGGVTGAIVSYPLHRLAGGARQVTQVVHPRASSPPTARPERSPLSAERRPAGADNPGRPSLRSLIAGRSDGVPRGSQESRVGKPARVVDQGSFMSQ